MALLVLLLFTITLFSTVQYFLKSLSKALVVSIAGLGLFVLISTESLSVFRLLHPTGLLICYSIATLLLLYFNIKKKYYLSLKARLKLLLKETPPLAFVLYLALSIVIGFLFFLAVYAPPNNWDSMTYHLPRLMHWIQNQSIAHYGTQIDRQLKFPPLAEYHILHLQLLSGADRFSNCVQWLAFVGNLFLVYTITLHLTGNKIVSVFSQIIAATIPMHILQATSTQNDAFASFWLLLSLYSLIEFIKEGDKDTSFHYWLFPISIFLGIASKGTLYLLLIPLVIIFAILFIKRSKKTKRLVSYTCIIILSFIFLNGPHFLRNYQSFQTALGPSKEMNEAFAPKAILGNIIKATSLHLSGKSPELNKKLKDWVEQYPAFLGIDEFPTEYTFGPGSYLYEYRIIQEDYAVNSTHFILYFSSILVFFVALIKKKLNKLTLLYIGLGLLLYLMIPSFIKWQQWESRLQLPVFVMMAVFPSLALSMVSSKRLRHTFIVLMAAFLFIHHYDYFYKNESKSLKGTPSIFTKSRLEQRCRLPYDGKTAYDSLFDIIYQHYDENQVIGLDLPQEDEDWWEYNLWAIAAFEYGKKVKFRNYIPQHKTHFGPYVEWSPQLIVRRSAAPSSYPENFKRIYCSPYFEVYKNAP